MKSIQKLLFLSPLLLLFFLLNGLGGSGCYTFKDIGTIPDSVRTVRVRFIENRAPYVNPRLSPALTENLRQKVIRQTRLTTTNSESADWDINATITDYSVSTTGVSSTASGPQTSTLNRLTISMNIVVLDKSGNKVNEYSVSRPFDFDARLTLQAAEGRLQDEIILNLTNEIFNRLFSNW